MTFVVENVAQRFQIAVDLAEQLHKPRKVLSMAKMPNLRACQHAAGHVSESWKIFFNNLRAVNSDAEVGREVKKINHDQNEDVENDAHCVELGEKYLKTFRLEGEQSKAGAFR